MNNPENNQRRALKEKAVTAEESFQIFLRCLNNALRDERWHMFISAELRRHELPVIELDCQQTEKNRP
jgi:hypothetical protein